MRDTGDERFIIWRVKNTFESVGRARGSPIPEDR